MGNRASLEAEIANPGVHLALVIEYGTDDYAAFHQNERRWKRLRHD